MSVSQTAPCLIESLAEHCQRHLLAEKWLIAPSLRIGRQWVEQVVRRGIPVVNLHVKTLPRLARDLTERFRPGVGFLSARGSAILLDRLISRLRQAGSPYLAALRPGAGLAQAIHDSLAALRLAGVQEKQLISRCFEDAGKAAELRKLLRAYTTELEARNLLDQAGCLQAASQALKTDTSPLPAGLLILVPEELPATKLEQALLDTLPAGCCHRLPAEEHCHTVNPSSDLTDAERLRWSACPVDAPPARHDGTANIFRAVGEVNEVREVLRRCLGDGSRLDDVELLHTDADTYIPLIYELFARLHSGEQGDGELPVTFAEGVPVRYSRPGRALTLWMRWVGDGFPQDVLVHLLREALIDVPQPVGEAVSYTRLAGWLRALPIGLGRERYLSVLDDQCAALEQRASAREQEENESADSTRAAALDEQRRGLQMLRRLIENLQCLAPPAHAGPMEVLQAAESFLRQHARAVTELDRNAGGMLLSEIGDMMRWIGLDEEPISRDVRFWLAGLPGECRVLGSGPRPGCLHVAHVLSGGHTGRPHLFVIGLDDGRFPGAGLQDPLLLDGERRRLSEHLPTAADRLRDKLLSFGRLMARHRGTITLGFSCQNLIDDRETFPSPVVLAAYRILSGNVEGDQGDLLAWLERPASFAPERPETCLDATEWWLWRLCGTEVVVAAEKLVAECFPHLGCGLAAATERASDAMTVYDGLVPEAGRDHDPLAPNGPVMSASRLETIGRCPRAYYFQYVLGLEPPQELTIDPSRWLDPLSFGSLLHEVFEQFFAESPGPARPPAFDHDWQRLSDLLDGRIKIYRQRFPSPNESVFRRQCQELRQAARIFLQEEEEYAQQDTLQPAYLEAAIGMPNPGRGTTLDSAESVTVPLPGGRKFRARAWIDRLDRFLAGQDPTFALWDYKTGSTWKYSHADPFRQGRVVQNILYPLVATARLRQAISPRARITQFGLFFPGIKGRGERIVWSPEELAGGPEILLRLCQVAGRGAFLATNDSKTDCTYCNFLPICGDVEALAATSRSKMVNSSNIVLQPFLRLRQPG
jgi:ATP-dependent helicase/nuclease subunit B